MTRTSPFGSDCTQSAERSLTEDRPQLEGAHVAPDPRGPPDRTPIQVGEVWENPVTRERATILELPYKNHEGRATAELTALVGAQVIGSTVILLSSSASPCSRVN